MYLISKIHESANPLRLVLLHDECGYPNPIQGTYTTVGGQNLKTSYQLISRPVVALVDALGSLLGSCHNETSSTHAHAV